MLVVFAVVLDTLRIDGMYGRGGGVGGGTTLRGARVLVGGVTGAAVGGVLFGLV